MTNVERRLKVEELRKNELELSIQKGKKKLQIVGFVSAVLVSAVLAIATISGKLSNYSWGVIVGAIGFGIFSFRELIESTKKITQYENTIADINMELAVYEENEREKVKKKI